MTWCADLKKEKVKKKQEHEEPHRTQTVSSMVTTLHWEQELIGSNPIGLRNTKYIKNQRIKEEMPQLVPFYFMNLLTFGIILFSVVLYVNATRILPALLKRKLVRQAIVKG